MTVMKRILVVVITALVAFALVIAAYFVTKDKVKENEEKKIEQAFEAVYPDAASFDEANYRTDYLQRFLEENGYPDDQVYVNKVTFARNEVRDVQGIVVQVSSYKKYGGIISMLVGVKNDGTVNGYSILNISDAKGLDFKVRDSEFSDQFKDKKADRFTLVNYQAKLANEILSANGAEDASQAVLKGVNAALLTNTFVDEYFGGVLGQ